MKTRTTAFIVFSLFILSVSAQVEKSILDLPVKKGILKELKRQVSTEKKIKLLKLIPEEDHVQFVREDYNPDYGDDQKYYDLDTSGLYFIDLDLDGDLDLLYSGQSGFMGRMGTKVYLNTNNQLLLNTAFSGSILEIIKKPKNYEFYIVENPCCDSYTTRLSNNTFERDSLIKTEYTVFMIGQINLKQLPNFETKHIAYIENTNLYAAPQDFKQLSPYFGNRTKDIRDSLKVGHFIPLAHIKNKTKVTILDKQTINKEVWHLVLTEKIALSASSLFEQAQGSNNRFIGWVKNVEHDR